MKRPLVKLDEIFPGYIITSTGKVWSVRRQRYLKQSPNSNGYLCVRPVISGKVRTQFVHNLVATAFVKKPSWAKEVRHLDGIRTHNESSNLKWGTAKQNASDRRKHGRTACGERHGRSKLTSIDVTEIRRRFASGESKSVIASDFKISIGYTRYIVKKISWKHV